MNNTVYIDWDSNELVPELVREGTEGAVAYTLKSTSDKRIEELEADLEAARNTVDVFPARLEAIRNVIFERIEQRIEDAPADGMAANGEFSDVVELMQTAYIQGLRSARLAAITVLKTESTA